MSGIKGNELNTISLQKSYSAQKSSGRIVARVMGCGSYLPDKIVTNDDLATSLDTSDEWIFSRTGIRSRHIASSEQLTSDLAVAALRNSIAASVIASDEIDCIILATTTPDLIMPATAIRVQRLVGATKAAAFDIQAVCSGFLYAMTIADSMIKSGQAHTVAVIGAEIMSRIVDWNDRRTCVLFGDGAGAMILQGEEIQDGEANGWKMPKISGIEDMEIISYPELQDALYTSGGIAAGNLNAKMMMDGAKVFKHAIEKMSSLISKIIAENGYTGDDISWILPHQANIRILQAVSERLKLPMSKFMVTMATHANTSAASIPLALDVYVKNGLVQKGQLIVLVTAGAGMTFGVALLRW